MIDCWCLHLSSSDDTCFALDSRGALVISTALHVCSSFDSISFYCRIALKFVFASQSQIFYTHTVTNIAIFSKCISFCHHWLCPLAWQQGTERVGHTCCFYCNNSCVLSNACCHASWPENEQWEQTELQSKALLSSWNTLLVGVSVWPDSCLRAVVTGCIYEAKLCCPDVAAACYLRQTKEIRLCYVHQ